MQPNLQKLPVELIPPPDSPLMSQPPHDVVQGNAALFHYTWGTLVEDKITRNKVWIFDKREYTDHDLALQVSFCLCVLPSCFANS